MEKITLEHYRYGLPYSASEHKSAVVEIAISQGGSRGVEYWNEMIW